VRAVRTPAPTVTLEEYDRQVARGMSEAVWQNHVITLLLWCGFPRDTIYHTRNSIGSQKGFPDLVAIRHRAGVSTLVLVELKRQNGKLKKEQEVWLAALRSIAAVVNGMCSTVRVVVDVWRPADRGRILELLRNETWKE
jgi:hypothetical protein